MSNGRVVALDRIRHMVSAAATIEEYVRRGRPAFDADSALRDAVLYQIIVIGEAAKEVLRADPTIAAETPEIEWSPWARMRDRVTHQYWATNLEIVWQTAAQDVPTLKAALSDAVKRLES